jgi:predicted CXXCH cytochrome family protein
VQREGDTGDGRAARNARLAVSTALAAAFVAFAATARAGSWHHESTAACSDCHTMHNSRSGQPMRYDDAPDGAPYLLRHATAESLCVYCHDGSNPDAPDVLAPQSSTYAAADPGGGAFQAFPGTATPNGHDLLLPAPVVPPLGDRPMTLGCTTCHDPHGTPSFRNLRPNPSGSGATTPDVLATEIVRPNGHNPAQAYASSSVRHRSGISSWCIDCHVQYDPAGGSHPVDVTIANSSADYATAWATDIETLRGYKRLRVATADDLVPSEDDQPICLTCHKAHGAPRDAGLIYPDGATLDSNCTQCHAK